MFENAPLYTRAMMDNLLKPGTYCALAYLPGVYTGYVVGRNFDREDSAIDFLLQNEDDLVSAGYKTPKAEHIKYIETEAEALARLGALAQESYLAQHLAEIVTILEGCEQGRLFLQQMKDELGNV